MTERYIVAIETGSSKIRGAAAVADESGMLDVVAVEEEKLIDSVRYGCIQNIDVSKAIERVCERLESSSALQEGTITGVYVALGGRSLRSDMVTVATELPAEMEITPAIIEDLKAKARAASDASRDVAAVVPVRFTVDNKTQANPVGTFGQSVGARMAVLTCAPQIKRMLRRVIEERLGMKIQDYIVRPLAEAALVLTDDERRLGCMFVDFGAETTTVAIFKNDAPAYLVTLPMGSRNITIDLTSLNYIEERAEEIKRISGNAMPAEGPRRPGVDGIDYSEVNTYVNARASEIIQNIVAQLEYAGMKAADLPGGIVIVGGGARLRGFSDLLGKHSKMKVRNGAVTGSVRISDSHINAGDYIDVISILQAAARLPETECVEFPEETETPEHTADGDYESMYADDADDDESTSRIGRGYDDDDDDDDDRRRKRSRHDRHDKGAPQRRRTAAKDDEFIDDDITDDEEMHRSSGIFSKLKNKLTNIFDGDGDDNFK